MSGVWRFWRGLLRWLWRLALLAVALATIQILLASLLPPVSTLMLARWATLRPVERVYVPLERISPYLKSSVVMSEDARFCRHGGVDWAALDRVLSEAGDDGPSRGASTLTMQVAKNLLLWPGRSYLRKGLELPLALVLDLVWSKKKLLEVYLNIAEWGDGVFGAEAGARASFGKSAAALTPREAALMATSLPNPIERRAERPTRRHAALAAIVSRRAAAASAWTDCLR